jgi:hypothetical protein
MNRRLFIPIFFILGISAGAQNPPASSESRFDTRFSLSVIDDATFYGDRSQPVPGVLNQVLVEPSFRFRALTPITTLSFA